MANIISVLNKIIDEKDKINDVAQINQTIFFIYKEVNLFSIKKEFLPSNKYPSEQMNRVAKNLAPWTSPSSALHYFVNFYPKIRGTNDASLTEFVNQLLRMNKIVPQTANTLLDSTEATVVEYVSYSTLEYSSRAAYETFADLYHTVSSDYLGADEAFQAILNS